MALRSCVKCTRQELEDQYNMKIYISPVFRSLPLQFLYFPLTSRFPNGQSNFPLDCQSCFSWCSEIWTHGSHFKSKERKKETSFIIHGYWLNRWVGNGKFFYWINIQKVIFSKNSIGQFKSNNSPGNPSYDTERLRSIILLFSWILFYLLPHNKSFTSSSQTLTRKYSSIRGSI